jgi:hypothetical protein
MSYLKCIQDLAQFEQAGWSHRMQALVASGVPLNADTATFSAAMKTDFIGPIRDGLTSGKVLLFGGDSGNPEGFQGITKSSEHINAVGNEFRIPWKATRNQAVGFRLENERLMSPGSSSYTYLTEPLRAGYGLFNITGPLLKAAESDAGSFKNAFKQEMEDTVTASKSDWNRAAFGDGTGVLAGIAPAGEAIGQTVISVDSTINFRGGEVIDFTTIAGVVVDAARTVIAVDRAAVTITIDAAITQALVSGTDFIVRASSSSTAAIPNNSLNREIQGLSSIVAATGTLHGINPTTYPRFKSYVAPGVGALADLDLHTALDTVGFETGVDLESEGDFVMVTTRGVRSRYAQTLTSLKQFTNAEALHLRGGFKVLDFDGRPMYTDDQCQLGRLYGLSTKSLFWAEAGDWDWMDQDGSVLKHETGYDRYQAVLYKYANLGTTQRDRHFLLSGITDDAK